MFSFVKFTLLQETLYKTIVEMSMPCYNLVVKSIQNKMDFLKLNSRTARDTFSGKCRHDMSAPRDANTMSVSNKARGQEL